MARTVRTGVQRHLGRLYGTRNRNLPSATGKTAAKGATAASPTDPLERDATPATRIGGSPGASNGAHVEPARAASSTDSSANPACGSSIDRTNAHHLNACSCAN